MKAAVLEALERARAGLSMREDNFFLLLSVIIGLFAGLAVVCFRITIDYTRLWLLGSGINPGPARVVLVPTVAGLLLAFIVLRIFPRVKGSGVTQDRKSTRLNSSHRCISYAVFCLKKKKTTNETLIKLHAAIER